MAAWNVGILTSSDKGARGEREDLSGQVIREMVRDVNMEVTEYIVIPDEFEVLRDSLLHFCDEVKLDLVVTTGGTGLAKRDVTPEATLAVIDREVPGMAEAMRAASLAKTQFAMLSRAVVGTRGNTLIVNLPGSPKGVRECLEVILPVIPHALEILQGTHGEHK
ncbi:MogA/MoaB family molybdenum cofactor biosynthesis protein [Tumebacillus sp. ITR2]|uniref:MogA/MoaB family molybdenum cofactor biosynthesis protein n=1 Tax=Tumebacillus amylolyticus TaxID=2801339 RepID=A0ABS1JBU8_9BACL|nr:MogA/MoaB family molybdenum cofactor biosynthesis protein [Tumebacillus amylolyticus]MBL0387514.1 MogA/MoaB family molybdenum cofactor biosynthesis protein [Tumebacillus amylolyticus]